MNIKIPYFVLFLLTCICSLQNAAAKKIHNRHYKFDMAIPDRMMYIKDSSIAGESELYYDTSAGIILMISVRESKFKSVDDYINCTMGELEQKLRINYGDTTLKLISCNKSLYYPKKTTALHFGVSVLPFEYDTYMMYFIHHHHKDIQISFTYKKANEQKSLNYINAVMQTLKLKSGL